MPTLSIPDVVNGDNILTVTNLNNALVEAALNNIDGALLLAGSVPLSALANQNALFTYTSYTASIGASQTLGATKMPLVNGATFSGVYLGATIFARVITGAPTTDAVNIKLNGTTIQSTLISAITAGTVYDTPAVSTVTSSGDTWSVDYNYAASTLTDLTVILYFETPLVR